MRLFRYRHSPIVEHVTGWFALPSQSWDAIVNRDDLHAWLTAAIAGHAPLPSPPDPANLLAPIGSQEVWAAGVTYFRSRTARMEESKSAGGGDFYDRVYGAERPELFFKASPHRVRGSGEAVRIRRDARWNVPEPELTLAVTSSGAIVGYTIGNDMSSRDIEGENPLYLPQAKIWDGSCALGPAILVTDGALPPDTAIELEIRRRGVVVQHGATRLDRMRRSAAELVSWLFRECSFPAGAILLTGTGVVPEPGFTLASGDEISIAIEPIGELVNRVA